MKTDNDRLFFAKVAVVKVFEDKLEEGRIEKSLIEKARKGLRKKIHSY